MKASTSPNYVSAILQKMTYRFGEWMSRRLTLIYGASFRRFQSVGRNIERYSGSCFCYLQNTKAHWTIGVTK